MGMNVMPARRAGAGMGRGAIILMLLASAACQQSGDTAQTGQGGMFGSGSGKQDNGSSGKAANGSNAAAPAPGAGPASVVAPASLPGQVPAPAPPPSAPGPTPAPAAQPQPSAPAAEDRRVRINNRSGKVIAEIRGSPAREQDWGRDRIPQDVLADGRSVIVDFNDNNGECVYDLQVTFADGARRDQGGVDICRVSDWTITPTGTATR